MLNVNIEYIINTLHLVVSTSFAAATASAATPSVTMTTASTTALTTTFTATATAASSTTPSSLAITFPAVSTTTGQSHWISKYFV